MIIAQTAQAKEENKLPSMYEFLTAAHVRGLLRTESELRRFRNIEAGVKGEDKMISFLEKYGRKDWIVLRNTWLNDSGSFECDIILITHHGIYLFEVKNYVGKLIYEQGACTLDGWEIPSNPIHQARRAFRGLKNILQRHHNQLHVKAALVFIGERNPVVVKDSLEEFAILQLTDIYHYIEQIKAEEDSAPYYPDIGNKTIQLLEKYETVNPFRPDPISGQELGQSRKGIYCFRCQNYNVEIQKHKVVCLCGEQESRNLAILRSVCEYGILRFDRDYFRISEIRDFLNDQASKTYLSELLPKYLKRIPNQHVIKLQNPKKPF